MVGGQLADGLNKGVCVSSRRAEHSEARLQCASKEGALSGAVISVLDVQMSFNEHVRWDLATIVQVYVIFSCVLKHFWISAFWLSCKELDEKIWVLEYTTQQTN